MLVNVSKKLQKSVEWFYDHPIETTILSLILSIGISKLLFINLNIDNDLYYVVLSSIFQGMFSILALAGVFIVFKTEQLSNEISKYDNNINIYINEISNSQLRNIDGSFLTKDELIAIRKLLFNRDKKETEENLKKKNDEIENKIKKLERMEGNKTHLDEIEQFRQYFDNYSRNIALVFESESLKSDLIKFFKLPFLNGMLIIILAIYFLPLIDWKSNLSWHTPITIVIGTSIILTIIVVLEISYLINISMWGKIKN